MGDEPRGVGPGVTLERVLAVAGVIVLLGIGVAIVLTIAGAIRDDPEEAVRAGASRPTPTPTATATPEPTPRPYTRRERAERAAAARIVRDRGFTVTRLGDYDARSRLRVLVGRDSNGGRLAFFFAGDGYIGNDATEPSAELRLRRQRDRQVTLAYGVYAPGDERCCPTGGPVLVRFALRGAAVVPRDPLPPAEQRSPAYQPA